MQVPLGLLVLILALVFSLARSRSTLCGDELLVFTFMAAALPLAVACHSRSSCRLHSQSAGSAEAPSAATKALYQSHCQRCHGESGRGERGAGVEGLPDFTSRAFHGPRSNAQLVSSILEGKGASMPAFRGKLSEQEARALMSRIRAFGPQEPAKSPAEVREPSDFEAQFEELVKELKDLQRQVNELNAAPGDREKQPALAAQKDQDDEHSASLKTAAPLYRQHCQPCHGADGKGDPKKSGTERPRDFTRRNWQQERSDAQLIATVLDGNGTAMPAFDKKLSKEEVEALVDYIRAFNRRRSTAPSKLRTPPEG